MESCLVFSIEEFSVFDGPGIRSTVFLKGCPLRCGWCHNPEGQSFENYVIRSQNGCISCGGCFKRAESKDGKTAFGADSVAGCPRNLLRYCAVEYMSDELCAKLSKNFAILNSSGGGVTFSGGEPLANHNFLLECLRMLDGKTHRAVQTSGYANESVFLEVLEECDYMLFDVKLIDGELHKRYCGVSNELILKNLKHLASNDKKFVIRMPMIPSVTDTVENVRAVAKTLLKNGIKYIELLPYNKLAGAKYPIAGRKYEPSFDGSAEVKMRLDIFEEYGIEAVRM